MAKQSPQRDGLRFYKAFFEVVSMAGTRDALARLGAQSLSEPPPAPTEQTNDWYWWHEPPRADRPTAAFTIRIRGQGLIMEGPTAEAVGRGWRLLDEKLRPHALARVAAGDDLQRFLPAKRRHSGDLPATWSPDYERRVLREFYNDFCARWARTPQHRLDDRSPLEAAAHPELRGALRSVLANLDRIEQERRERGMPAIAVAELRALVFPDEEERDGP